MKYITFEAFGWFVAYALSNLALLLIFARLYLWITPYHEMVEIKKGNTAPAIALSGALIGYTFPLLSVTHSGVNYIDFIIWAGVAAVVQLALFKVLYWILPFQIEEENKAEALIYASMAICVGMINALSLIPA
jgi:putative membrane protein